MESHPSVPVILSIFSIFFLLNILVKRRRKAQGNHKLPPGPTKLPMIGNLHHLVSPSRPGHHTITNLGKKYGPVMSLQIGQLYAVVLSSAEATHQVLKIKDLSFAQRPQKFAGGALSEEGSMFFAPYGDKWRNLRKIFVNELVSAMRVKSFRSIREEETWNMMENISKSEGTAVEISENIKTLTNDIISLIVFGKKCKEQGEFMALLNQMVQTGTGINLLDLFPSLKFLRNMSGIEATLKKINGKLIDILDGLITEHRMEPKNESEHENILDVLLRLQKSNQETEFSISDNKMKQMMTEMFIAASDTTATTTEWAMAEMVKNPRVMKKAQEEVRQALNGKTKVEEKDIQDLHYLKSVIKETLRLHPPAPFLLREAREDCEICGYNIPAETILLLNLWGISRDANVWTEPDSFKPERFQNSEADLTGNQAEYTPFGGGRRICPGIPFAAANIELALAQLLYHFDWTLPGATRPEDLDMTETFGIAVTKKINLQLIPTIHIPFCK